MAQRITKNTLDEQLLIAHYDNAHSAQSAVYQPCHSAGGFVSHNSDFSSRIQVSKAAPCFVSTVEVLTDTPTVDV